MKFFLCFFFAISFALPAAAQNVYIQKNKPQQTAPDDEDAQRQLQELLQEEEQKQQAQKSVQDYANDYYQNCLKQEHPVLKGEDLQLLCGCTSAKFAENMTLKQIQVMNTDTKEGLYQRNRMMMFVYAPCIEFPTHALLLHQCMNDTKVRYTMKHPAKTCECLASGVAQDMKERAPDVIKNALALNPKDLDPLALLMNSNAFESRSRYHTQACIQKYELGFGRQ